MRYVALLEILGLRDLTGAAACEFDLGLYEFRFNIALVVSLLFIYKLFTSSSLPRFFPGCSTQEFPLEIKCELGKRKMEDGTTE